MDEQTTQTTEQTETTAENTQNTEQTPSGADKQTEPAPKTFTQEEVNKIISERQKRWEKKAADDKAEAERVAKMTAEQKARHEQEKREKAIAEREEQLTRRERTATAAEELRKLGVPAELLAAVDISSDEVISESAGKVAKAFNDAVNAEVAKRIAGAPPKAGASNNNADPFVEGFGT